MMGTKRVCAFQLMIMLFLTPCRSAVIGTSQPQQVAPDREQYRCSYPSAPLSDFPIISVSPLSIQLVGK
jgi:hypothetical protein